MTSWVILTEVDAGWKEREMMIKGDIIDKVRTDRRGLFNLDRLKEGMKKNNLDAVVATSPLNVTYTGGMIFPIRSPGLRAFVITTVDGNQGVVIDEAEAFPFREYSWIRDIRDFRYSSSLAKANKEAIGVLAEMLMGMGLSRGRLGIEKTDLPALYWEELIKVVPETELEDGTEVFNFARVIKTTTEIELYRAAAYYTAKAIHTAFALAKEGDTEKFLASQVQSNALKLGAESLEFIYLQAGEHSTVVHSFPIENPIRQGEVVYVDFGAVFGGYRTDICRNAIVGRAKPNQEEIYNHLWRIQQLLFDNMRPGVLAGELYEIGQKAFSEAGLVHPWGIMGHSIGCGVHEEGYDIAQGSIQILEAGMIVCVEPSHIVPGEARYCIEDVVLVKGDSIEVLSDCGSTDNMFVIQ